MELVLTRQIPFSIFFLPLFTFFIIFFYVFFLFFCFFLNFFAYRNGIDVYRFTELVRQQILARDSCGILWCSNGGLKRAMKEFDTTPRLEQRTFGSVDPAPGRDLERIRNESLKESRRNPAGRAQTISVQLDPVTVFELMNDFIDRFLQEESRRNHIQRIGAE